jgi:hypothetical protein
MPAAIIDARLAVNAVLKAAVQKDFCVGPAA